MLKIKKTGVTLEEIKKIVDEISSYKTEKLKGLPKASYIEEYKNLRNEYTTQEWLNLIFNTIGYDADTLTPF